MNKHEQALKDIKELIKRVKITMEVKEGLTLIVANSILTHDLEILERSVKNLGAKQVNELLKGE